MTHVSNLKLCKTSSLLAETDATHVLWLLFLHLRHFECIPFPRKACRRNCGVKCGSCCGCQSRSAQSELSNCSFVLVGHSYIVEWLFWMGMESLLLKKQAPNVAETFFQASRLPGDPSTYAWKPGELFKEPWQLVISERTWCATGFPMEAASSGHLESNAPYSCTCRRHCRESASWAKKTLCPRCQSARVTPCKARPVKIA